MSFLDSLVQGIKSTGSNFKNLLSQRFGSAELPNQLQGQNNIGQIGQGGSTNNIPLTQNALNSFKLSINPINYTTPLNDTDQNQFNLWANDMRASGKIGKDDTFKDYDMQGYWKNEVSPFQRLKDEGYEESVIQGVKQGLNQGNKNLANFIKQQGIRTPNSEDEITLARQGKFNPVNNDFSNKYAMPNNPTFSNESQYYNNENAKYAGRFENGNFISPSSRRTNSTRG